MRKIRIFLISMFVLNSFLVQANQYDIGVDDSFWSIATRSGNIELIQKSLQLGMDVNAYDQNSKNTALMNAIESGNIDSVRLLVNSGADVNSITSTADNQKKCALTLAFRYPEILKYLIESGADVNIKLSQKQTPLHYAASCETNYEAVCILLKHGAKIDAIDLYGRTPLHFGIMRKKIGLALIDNGANFHVVDHNGWKPLHTAYMFCEINLLKELIERASWMR